MNRWQRLGLGWLLVDIILLLMISVAPPEARPDFMLWAIAVTSVVGFNLFAFAGKD